jgi:hypothetical protein
LVGELKAAVWKPSPRTAAIGQCEFLYQPEAWAKAYRFVALQDKKRSEREIVKKCRFTQLSSHC